MAAGSDIRDIAGVPVDFAAVRAATRVILVEGGSDRAAVQALAARRGQLLGDGGLHVVAMGGVTSIGHFLARLGPGGIDVRLAGLYDADTEDFVLRALAQAGMPAAGFCACRADLEDELIRAAGTSAVEQVIQAQGELRSFRLFQRQPAQRARGTAAQLHRFFGTRSGRKSQYTRLLARALDLDRIPGPLDRVLADRR